MKKAKNFEWVFGKGRTRDCFVEIGNMISCCNEENYERVRDEGY